MESSADALNWFEIPVVDMQRAQDFYEGIFDMKMVPMAEMVGMQMVGFPTNMESGKVGGALAKSEYHEPSEAGVVVYLNANPDIQSVIDRIEGFGGTVIMPKMEISPEVGFMAFFNDTEGNRVALHAQK